MSKTIITITAIVFGLSLAGCNEDPQAKQAADQAADAAKANDAISKSTAAPSSTPSQRKYKY